MDIIIDTDNQRFNYRVGIVLILNNYILMQKSPEVSHYTLPGGRCQLGETSIEAGIREFYEETGLEIEHLKSLGMIENFFKSSYNLKNYHEILIVHEYKFKNKNLNTLPHVDNIEGKDLKYVWLNIPKLSKNKIEPNIIINILNNKEFNHYLVKN